MKLRLLDYLNKNKFIVLAIIWLLIWLVPWAGWIGSNWLRLGTSVVLFIVPGTMFSMLLIRDRFEWPLHLLSGLALSVFFVSILGLLGRIFELPFSYIKPTFILIGLISFIVIHFHSDFIGQWYKSAGISVKTLLVLTVIIVGSILITLQDRFGGDDLSNLANLTNWQHAQPLNFNENIFGTGNVDKLRFWLAMFPMNLAFLSQISNLHGLLLLGFYLEPLLMAISVLAIYFFYRYWLRSENQTVAALALHFAFFFMLQDTQQIGVSIFWRLSEDKSFAAFILAPILFIAFLNFLDEFNLRHGVFLLMISWGLAFTHPIILAYCLFIISVAVAVSFLPKKEYKKLGILAALVAVAVAPVAPLRFIDVPTSPKTFDLASALENGPTIQNTRISYIEGTPFYGFHPQRIQLLPGIPKDNLLETFFSWSYLWLVLIGLIWSFFNFRRHPTAPFILASALLLLLCLIPYTGWLIGKFVTARMLWRAPWLLPIGGFGVILLDEFANFSLSRLQNQQFRQAKQAGLIIILAASSWIGWYFSTQIFTDGQYDRDRWGTFEELNNKEYKIELSNLASVGTYVETNLEQPSIFIGRLDIMSLLPGLSSKMDTVLFRSTKFSSQYVPQLIEVIDVYAIVYGTNSASIEQRLAILRKFNIEYIFDDGNYMKDYYSRYPEFFSMQKIGKFWLIEFHDNHP